MADFPQIERVQFGIVDERLKVVMPLYRQWPFLVTYTVLLLAWIGATGWMLALLFGADTTDLTTQFMIVWIVILLIWAYIWYRLGRMVWRWWQYYAATREVLFVDDDILIIRRPLSLLGVTDAFDMDHVSPFYYSDKHTAIAFDYGSRGGLFATGVARAEAEQLIAYLNDRYFPNAVLFDDE